MGTTFMTIHNLTPNANILFASESIADVLGYQPYEVIGRSCFDYFHPDEIPFARHVHNRGVQLDKAAVLHYARIQDRSGGYVGCECVFSIVYNVLVACTSIYQQDARNQERALQAPAIRRLFATPPRDIRYHMLDHLAPKFNTPEATIREPRAALILNRFTRTLPIMFATNAVYEILGVTPEQLTGKSFYECIKESCFHDAIRCLESAKANDSIAYLRFVYRDPRHQEEREQLQREASQGSSDEEDGGAVLDSQMDVDPGMRPATLQSTSGHQENVGAENPQISNTRSSSENSAERDEQSARAMFDRNDVDMDQSSSSPSTAPDTHGDSRETNGWQNHVDNQPSSRELEAVVSCTSDGLVVVIRRARPMPVLLHPSQAVPADGGNVFAAPWGVDFGGASGPVPARTGYQSVRLEAAPNAQARMQPVGGPSMNNFMNSIREVAVFAWSLTGINGRIAEHTRGTPQGNSLPQQGLPVWDPQAQHDLSDSPENQAYVQWKLHQHSTHRPSSPMRYSHPREEALLRQQNGFGERSMEAHVQGPYVQRYFDNYTTDPALEHRHLQSQEPLMAMGYPYQQHSAYGADGYTQ